MPSNTPVTNAVNPTMNTLDNLTAENLKPRYQRVLLKMSGEAFGHSGQTGISITETLKIAEQIKRIVERGVQLAIVVGGGNMIRGAQFSAGSSVVKEATAHYMGMLATMMNGLALQETLESINCETRVMTALRLDNVAEYFIRRRAIRHLEKGRVVILAGGTGNPFVTTDTAAALRGVELEANVLLKATRVDGIYNDNPEKNHHAIRYEKLSFDQVWGGNLMVMDMAAIDLCRSSTPKLPIIVFNYKKEGNLEKVIAGQSIGTLVS